MQIKSDRMVDHSKKENCNNWKKKADFLKMKWYFPIKNELVEERNFYLWYCIDLETQLGRGISFRFLTSIDNIKIESFPDC